MEKSIFGNKIGFGGLAGLTKKVAAAPAKEVPAAKAPSAFKADALVRSGAVATPAAGVADANRMAELRLAKAYHADPTTFARNMARAALEDMVAHLG